jgi:hypothetical protein
MVRLVKAATINDWHSALTDAISDTITYMGIASTASLNPGQLQAPGVLVVDRISSTNELTPDRREYLSFASISGCTIYDVTRGLAGSTAQAHTIGSMIEDVPSVTHWGDLLDWLDVEHNSDGTHNVFNHVRQVTVTGVSGASGIRGDVVFVPGSNVSIYAASGASGYPQIVISAPTATPGGLPPFTVNGFLATATNVTPLILVENILNMKSVSAVLKSPASGVSLILDVNKNGTTIFGDQATRLNIAGGGTYASTASITVTDLTPGDILTLDIDSGTGDTLTCLLET